MDESLGGAHRYVQRHFGGQHLYLEEMERNMRFAKTIAEKRDLSMLRRKPPKTLCEEDEDDDTDTGNGEAK
jgi:hypothetical protein